MEKEKSSDSIPHIRSSTRFYIAWEKDKTLTDGMSGLLTEITSRLQHIFDVIRFTKSLTFYNKTVLF